MAYIFQTRTDGLGHALRTETAQLQQAIARADALIAHGLPGYRPEHDEDGQVTSAPSRLIQSPKSPRSAFTAT